jgi:DNA-binding NarL/FixJ family response regulator
LHGVLSASKDKLDRGHGLYAIAYELDAAGNAVMRRGASIDVPQGDVALGSILKRCTHGSLAMPLCATASAALGNGFATRTGLDLFGRARVRDVLGINVRDPTQFGCLLAGLMPRVGVLQKNDAQRWTRVMAHVAAGYRLQRARHRRLKPQAVLTPNGKIHYAEHAAALAAAREKLREAVVAIERSRRRMRVQEDDAILQRTPLVDARWSIIEDFQSDGRRYFLAHENAPSRAVPFLTDRERQVMSYAALGRDLKLIAYDMGIAWSTVRVLIARATAKLGVRTRSDALRVFDAMTRAMNASPSNPTA